MFGHNHCGIEILETIRRNKDLTELPGMIVSTSDLKKNIVLSYQTGANCYLIKASDPADYRKNLSAAVKFLLR